MSRMPNPSINENAHASPDKSRNRQVLPQNLTSSVRKIHSQIALVQLCGIACKLSHSHMEPLPQGAALRLSRNYSFADNLCFDFAKHGRPKVPMRKLSPSQSIKTVIHAPGFYDFALQNLFHARFRAKHCVLEKINFIDGLKGDGMSLFFHLSQVRSSSDK